MNASTTYQYFAAIKKDPGPIPPLKPPQEQIPAVLPDKMILGGVLFLGLAVLFLGRAMRKPRVVVPLPPEHPVVKARRALSQIHSDSPPVEAAAQAAQAVREYLRAAYGLGDEALTTTEICERFRAHHLTDRHSTVDIAAFLRDCELVQFAPQGVAPPSAFAARAWTLIDELEALRGAAALVPPPLPAAT